MIQFATLLAVLSTAPAAEATEAPPPDHPMLGEAAPAFSLPTLDGKTVELADFEGKFLVFHFGAGW